MDGREVRESAGPEGIRAYLPGHFRFEPGRLARLFYFQKKNYESRQLAGVAILPIEKHALPPAPTYMAFPRSFSGRWSVLPKRLSQGPGCDIIDGARGSILILERGSHAG
jgi:hypothetical protein